MIESSILFIVLTFVFFFILKLIVRFIYWHPFFLFDIVEDIVNYFKNKKNKKGGN